MNRFDHVSGKHFQAGSANIYYEQAGNKDGSPLVLLHGGFGNIEDLNSLLPELAAYKIIGIDTRGQGASTLGDEKLTYAQAAEDVERVLEHLEVREPIIIGFSDGGIIGLRLAAAGFKIEKLIVIGSDWHTKYLEPVREIFEKVTGESWRKKFPDTYEAYQRQNPEPDFDRLAKAMTAMWLDESGTGWPNETVKNITCPLLIVRGDEDHLTMREAMAELASRVKGSTYLNIPFAGHVAYQDQREIFQISLREFLAKRHLSNGASH